MNRESKNITIALLLICILTMAVGYSILQQRLNVEGTSNITSEFNIQVIGVREVYKEGLIETTTLDFTPTTATYGANIQAPGDYAIYEITIENKGTLSGYAEIEEILSEYRSEYTDVNIGLIAATNNQITYDGNINSFFDNIIGAYENNPSGMVVLEKGDKAYYYAEIYFNSNVTTLPSQKNYSKDIEFNFIQIDAYQPTSSKELTITKDIEKYSSYTYGRLGNYNITKATITDIPSSKAFNLDLTIERPTDDTEIKQACFVNIALLKNDGTNILFNNLEVRNASDYQYQQIVTDNVEVFTDYNTMSSVVTLNGYSTNYSNLNEVNEVKYFMSCIE